MHTHSSRSNIRKAYLAWFAASLFFFYQYILRVSPGVMVTDLRRDFHMTAEQFSSLGALYLYAYSLLQIPLGVLIDRWGVRRTLLSSVFLCIAGTLMLGSADSLIVVQLSRLLIGAGSACAFMSALKVAADGLPAGRRGFLMGATLTLGTIGPLVAGKPLVGFIESLGWRQTVLFTAVLGFVVFLIAYVLLRPPPHAASSEDHVPHDIRQLTRSIVHILRDRGIMIYAILAIGLYTPLSVLADLWGTAFLMQKFDLSRSAAATASMMMYLGLAMGSLFLPWACEKWNLQIRAVQTCGLAIFAIFGFLLFGPGVQLWLLTLLLIVLGFFCGAEMLCFSGAVTYATASNSGLIIGVVNTFNMLGGALLQQAIGALLDMQWQGALDVNGVRTYATHEFVMALSLLVAVIVLCFLMSLRLSSQTVSVKRG
jgi:MFS family permease